MIDFVLEWSLYIADTHISVCLSLYLSLSLYIYILKIFADILAYSRDIHGCHTMYTVTFFEKQKQINI